MADLRITELAALAGGNLAAGDLLAIADISASETKKITVTDLVGNAVTLIANATIPSAKILFGANTISGDALQDASVNTGELANDAVTAAKLADESSVDLVTTLPASGAFVGQIALDTDDSKIYCWNGGAWVSIKAAGSINTVVGDTAGIVNLTVTTSGDQVTITTSLDATGAAAQFLAGPTSAAGTVGYRTIAAGDLPTATTGAKGAVVVNGNGLTMSGDTVVINNTVTAEASNYHVVQYNAKGLVTGGRQIIAADVPVATASSIGVVKPGSGLGVDGAGTLNHNNSITPASAAKVTYDGQGHIVAALALSATDIPELDASKITTGTFASARLAANSVTAEQLADYGIAQVSSSQPVPEFAGQLWINPTDRTAYVWVGQVSPPQGYYLPLNNEFGAQANLRFGGTYNASTNTIASLNTYGAGAGLTVGSSLISPTASSAGVYLLVTTAGTGTSPAPAVSLDVGDWILSPGQGTTWTHVNLVGAGISVIDAGDVTFAGGSLTPAMTGVADAEAALTTLWGRVQIATPSTLGIVLETTEIEVNNSTGAMTIGTVDEGTY
jgi:hypothetical protein